MRSLERLFNPKSIAVVGASTDEYKAGYQMLYALKNYPGKLYPINPREKSILGFEAFTNLKAIGSPVDLVILTIPAAACEDVLIEAGESGAGAALIISGGFAETGEAGKIVQNRIFSVCKRYGIRLLGPNTAGFRNPAAGVSANFTPWIADIDSGPVGLISQSGAMSLTLAALIKTSRLGVSLITGIGNAADVTVSDAIEFLAEDENTKVIILYLEGVMDGRRLYDVIAKTADKKPVIVLTVGKADIAEFAASHTGNLIGSYKIKIAALKQAGAVVVDSADDLIDAANLLSRVRLEPNQNPGIGLLTGQAGPGMIIVDYLRSHGVLLPELTQQTVEKIKNELPPLTFVRNPVDTSRPGPSFVNVLKAVASDPSIDVLIIFAIHEPAVIDPLSLFKSVKDGIKQPLIFGTAGFPEHLHPTQNILDDMNISSFASPDRAARAVWALVEDSKAAFRRKRSLSQVDVMAEIPRLNVAPDEAEAKDVLDKAGIPTPKRVVCANHEEAKKAFCKLSKPCVAKVLSESIRHKTEAGGVILNIETETQLYDALLRIDIIPGNNKRYIIEEMAKPGIEIIIGALNDSSFGPVVLVGLGGTAAEALGDVAMRLAPLSKEDALDMLSELKGSALLNGWRGAPAVDKKSIAEAIVKVGQFIYSHPEVKEMDINPVCVYESGIVALDAMIVLKEDSL